MKWFTIVKTNIYSGYQLQLFKVEIKQAEVMIIFQTLPLRNFEILIFNNTLFNKTVNLNTKIEKKLDVKKLTWSYCDNIFV